MTLTPLTDSSWNFYPQVTSVHRLENLVQVHTDLVQFTVYGCIQRHLDLWKLSP